MMWEVKKEGYVNNYARGWEVFTTIKALKEYKKTIASQLQTDGYYIKVNELDAETLNHFLQTDTTSTIKTEYGYIEQTGVQFH